MNDEEFAEMNRRINAYQALTGEYPKNHYLCAVCGHDFLDFPNAVKLETREFACYSHAHTPGFTPLVSAKEQAKPVRTSEACDLRTQPAREVALYNRFFRNVLSFKDVESAQESVKKLSRLYDYFERLGDRAGQHQATVLALTGKNRARWSGKYEEAEIFNQWLMKH